jgi:hypothetical protein
MVRTRWSSRRSGVCVPFRDRHLAGLGGGTFIDPGTTVTIAVRRGPWSHSARVRGGAERQRTELP